MSINVLFRRLGQLCVISLVALGPWRNGGSEPRVLQIFMWLIVASGLCALGYLWTTPVRERQKCSRAPALWISVPLFLGLGLCVLQTVDLPDSLLNRLAPRVVELRNDLLPPELDITFSELTNGETERDPREFIDEPRELLDSNRAFLSRTEPPINPSEFDLERALIVDRALENEFLSQEETNRAPRWGSCISVYPLLTKSSIPLFWSAIVLLLSVSVLFNTVESRGALFKSVAFLGVLFALLCVCKSGNPNGVRRLLKPLWDGWLTYGQYGTYANKNAAGGYLVLTLAACVFLLVGEFLRSARRVAKERTERLKEEKELKKEGVYEVKSEPYWKVALGDLFDLFSRKLVLWVVCTSIVFASVFISLSRGASVAATVLSLVACFFLAFKKESRRFWGVFALVFALVIVFIFTTCMYDRVDKRMSTLTDEDPSGLTAVQKDSRWNNWKSALQSSKDYPWLGAGLGTYMLANCSRDVAIKNDFSFHYAENVFVQTLLEMGRVGLILLVLTYVLLFAFFGRFLFGRHSSETYAASLGAVVLVTGQLVAACGDFGNYMPANLLLFVALCGTVLGRQNLKQWEELNSALGKKDEALRAVKTIEKLRKRERFGAVVFSIFMVGALAASGWTFSENADSVRRWDLQAELARASSSFAQMSSDSLNAIVREYEKYVALRDDSFEMRVDLAYLRTTQFRLRTLEALKEAKAKGDDRQLWNATSTEFFLEPLLTYQKMGFNVPVKSIRARKNVVDLLRPATRDEFAARRICPLFCSVNRSLISKLPLTAELNWEDERRLTELYARRASSFMPYGSRELFNFSCYLSYFDLNELRNGFLTRTLENTTKFYDLVVGVLVAIAPGDRLQKVYDEVVPDDLEIAYSLFVKNAKPKTETTPLFKAASFKLDKVLGQVPDNCRDARYYFYRSILCERTDKLEDADANLLKAAEIDPNSSIYSLRRVRLLIKYRKRLDKDEECLRFVQELLPKLRGPERWECEKLLETAKANVRDAQARQRARERARKEREMDERIKREANKKKEIQDASSLKDDGA